MRRARPSRRPSNAERRLYSLAKYRARKRGIPFDLDVSDVRIPVRCPALGVRLERNVGGRAQHSRSPTLDRIDGKRGYVKGNVVVLSAKANAMKSTGTPRELERVAAFSRRLVQRHLPEES